MSELGKILIADDEETFLLSTADLLRRDGYQCHVVPDAESAAKALRESEYDLLIADIKMPGNNDLELIRQLPALTEGLPVILVTGYPSTKTAIDSIQLPVLAYVPKPLEYDELFGRVREGVRRYQAFKAMRRIRNRLRHWEEALRQVQVSSPELRLPGPETTMDCFLTITFQNLIDSLWDLKNLAQSLSLGTSNQDVCHMWTCPRLSFLKKGLEDTIEVLEKTKNSFKSKELGDLRKKLEGMMKTLS
jgi:DNA-binding response OmpR family regulator